MQAFYKSIPTHFTYKTYKKMGILKDLEKAADDIKSAVDKAAVAIMSDLKKVESDITTGFTNIKNFLITGFDEAEKDLINSKVSSILNDYAGEIKSLQTLATQGIASADIGVLTQDIKNIFLHNDSTAAAAVISNLITTTMQDMYSEFKAFDTLSLGLDGEIDLLFGVAAGASAGIEMKAFDNESKARVLVDFMASAGAEEGADVGLCLGVWKGNPSGMSGGYLAVTLDADEGAGAGVILYFTLSIDPQFSGIILDINAGEEVEFSIDCGFTIAVGMPSGT